MRLLPASGAMLESTLQYSAFTQPIFPVQPEPYFPPYGIRSLSNYTVETTNAQVGTSVTVLDGKTLRHVLPRK